MIGLQAHGLREGFDGPLWLLHPPARGSEVVLRVEVSRIRRDCAFECGQSLVCLAVSPKGEAQPVEGRRVAGESVDRFAVVRDGVREPSLLLVDGSEEKVGMPCCGLAPGQGLEHRARGPILTCGCQLTSVRQDIALGRRLCERDSACAQQEQHATRRSVAAEHLPPSRHAGILNPKAPSGRADGG